MSYPPPVIYRHQRGQRQRRVRHAGLREPSDDNTEDEDSNQDKRYETEELRQRDQPGISLRAKQQHRDDNDEYDGPVTHVP